MTEPNDVARDAELDIHVPGLGGPLKLTPGSMEEVKELRGLPTLPQDFHSCDLVGYISTLRRVLFRMRTLHHLSNSGPQSRENEEAEETDSGNMAVLNDEHAVHRDSTATYTGRMTSIDSRARSRRLEILRRVRCLRIPTICKWTSLPTGMFHFLADVMLQLDRDRLNDVHPGKRFLAFLCTTCRLLLKQPDGEGQASAAMIISAGSQKPDNQNMASDLASCRPRKSEIVAASDTPSNEGPDVNLRSAKNSGEMANKGPVATTIPSANAILIVNKVPETHMVSPKRAGPTPYG